jgi:hypothetical protein
MTRDQLDRGTNIQLALDQLDRAIQDVAGSSPLFFTVQGSVIRHVMPESVRQSMIKIYEKDRASLQQEFDKL